MEYHQITLTEYMSWKQEIQERLNQSADNFVNIGYLLKKIRDTKAYEQDGFATLNEWAMATYHLTAPSVSRFIKINDEYAEDGYSRLMKKEYEGYGYNQLYEMLALPDRSVVTQDTTVKEIRDIKNFEKESAKAAEPETEQVDADFKKAVETIFDGHEGLVELIGGDAFAIRRIKDEIMPMGRRNVRSGTLMVFLTPEEIKMKRFAGTTEILSWQQFLDKAAPLIHVKQVENEEEELEEEEGPQDDEPEEDEQIPYEKPEVIDGPPKDFDAEIMPEPIETQEENEEAAVVTEDTDEGIPEQTEPEEQEEELDEGAGEEEQEPQREEESREEAGETEQKTVEVIPPEDHEVVETAYDIDEMIDAARDILSWVKHKHWVAAEDQLVWLLEQVRTAKKEEENA